MNVLGVGGHAKVVIDAVLSSGQTITALYDDDPKVYQTSFCGYEVHGETPVDLEGDAIIAIGDNSARKKIDQELINCNWQTVIHPTAIVADNVSIGKGSVIMAGAIIQPNVKVGRHAIVNTGACIDHDCKIGDYCHIAPNCSIAGGVTINEGVFVGIGSSVIEYLSIGEWTNVGAGSIVIKDIPSNCTAVGIPAKPIKIDNE